MDSLQAFILLGGESRRMGTDKSRLMLNGESFLERIARQLSPVIPSITLVGDNTGKDLQLSEFNLPPGITHVADVYPHWGALGGLHAALCACTADWGVVVGCDFPFVTTELFERLALLREGFDAVAPIQLDLIPQPLCAVYRVEACLGRAEHLIKSGERKPLALLQSVRTRWVSFDELSDLEGAAHFFDNVNTPEDYARAKKNREVRPRSGQVE